MRDAYLCAYVRTPIGRFGGALSSVRADDLGAVPLKALMERHPSLDFAAVDEVVYGCANQAGEDNRNVARMSLLLAGLPESVPGTTSTASAARGWTRSSSPPAPSRRRGGARDRGRRGVDEPRALRHAEGRNRLLAPCGDPRHDDRLALRQPADESAVRRRFHARDGENVAEDFGISREDQDAFALRSQTKAAAAQANGRLAREIVPVTIPQRKGDPKLVDTDEHPRATTIEALAKLPTPFRKGGTVTAGNASGVNDGAAALIVASEAAARRHGLTPIARVLGGATAGVAPRIMGFGPAPASKKLMARLGLSQADFDVIELNEAFASQGLATLRDLGIGDDDARVNPNGGAIALGHPLGMSGARIAGTAALELQLSGGRRALATMCIGVGQGIAVALERV